LWAQSQALQCLTGQRPNVAELDVLAALLHKSIDAAVVEMYHPCAHVPTMDGHLLLWPLPQRFVQPRQQLLPRHLKKLSAVWLCWHGLVAAAQRLLQTV